MLQVAQSSYSIECSIDINNILYDFSDISKAYKIQSSNQT